MSDAVLVPTISAADWHAGAADALARTSAMIAAIPDGHHWAWIGGAAVVALCIIQRLAPLLPVVGPFLGPVMQYVPLLQRGLNAAWRMTSHADVVAADKAKDTVGKNAALLVEVLTYAKGIPSVSQRIPPALQDAARLLAQAQPDVAPVPAVTVTMP